MEKQQKKDSPSNQNATNDATIKVDNLDGTFGRDVSV